MWSGQPIAFVTGFFLFTHTHNDYMKSECYQVVRYRVHVHKFYYLYYDILQSNDFMCVNFDSLVCAQCVSFERNFALIRSHELELFADIERLLLIFYSPCAPCQRQRKLPSLSARLPGPLNHSTHHAHVILAYRTIRTLLPPPNNRRRAYLCLWCVRYYCPFPIYILRFGGNSRRLDRDSVNSTLIRQGFFRHVRRAVVGSVFGGLTNICVAHLIKMT